jgi:hypothetical protein
MVAMISVHRGFRLTRWLGTRFIVQAAMLAIGLLALGVLTSCSYFRIAVALGHSREVVEQSHGVRFVQSPQLFVCHTDCFKAYVPVGKEVAAAQLRNAVFMNDEVLTLRELQRGMPVDDFLTLELAHLLLYQRAGAMAYMRVPSWFREGIAVAVSNGAGAEACILTEAVQYIVAGKHFDPAENGGL